jgi:hypothetical protein
MTHEATKPIDTTRPQDAGAQSGGPSDSGSHSTAPFTNQPIGSTPRHDLGDKMDATRKPVDAPAAGAENTKGSEARALPAAADAVDAKSVPAGTPLPAAGGERAQEPVTKPTTPATPTTTAPLRTHPNQRMPAPDSKSGSPVAEPALKQSAAPKSS